MKQLSLIQRFYAFVFAQDPRKGIDHSSYNQCALGEFYSSEHDGRKSCVKHSSYDRQFILNVRNQMPTALELKLHSTKCEYLTYGDLQKAITELEAA